MTPIKIPQFARLIRRSVGEEISTELAADAHEISIARVAVDSRLIKPGDAFFALPGERVDGHHFLEDVSSKGAVAAIVQKDYSGPNFGLSLIKVNDGLHALQSLATKLLSGRKSRIIAVTGSVGKTTTKDFIATLLQEKYIVSSSPGNSNSQIGLPLAILNHTNGFEDFLILEMGMTHGGQISKLVNIAPPNYALITSVEYAHACNFSSIEAIATAKAEIFSHPKTQLGMLPMGIANFASVMRTGNCKKITFSTLSKNTDFFIEDCKDHLVVHEGFQKVSLPILNISGMHNLHNFLAAIALARSLSLEWEAIIDAIPKLVLPERRLQHIERNGVLFINDSYNAIPVAVKAALKSLPIPKPGGKTLFIFGEMLELGKLSDSMHRDVGELALEYVDQMLCFGDACRPAVECWTQAKRPAELFTGFDELLREFKRRIAPGDIVLLKGARKTGLWRILESLEESKQ